MSNVMINDETSRLKQFIWEELDDSFFLAVIFRSGRRYVVQRHFEQQLFDIKSSLIQNKWRQCLLNVLSKCLLPNYITYYEIELMHEIFSWHLNYGNNYTKLRENIDYIIDLEQLIDCFKLISIDDDSVKLTDTNINNSFIIQPVTTLDAARKNIEMWKNLQENFIENNNTNQIIDNRIKKKSTRTPSLTSNSPVSLPLTQSSSTTGWLQLDSKIVPFIKKHCDRLLPIDYLLKEHIISSSEDFSLRSLYIPIDNDDIQTFKTLFRQLSSSSNFLLTNYSSLITLDHLIFRLKRLFFIRFVSSPINIDYIDYHKIMSFNGGLITIINNPKQRIPFIYINKQIYIPQINNINYSSTFCMANKFELEYLRLISLYDYLSSNEINDYFINYLSINNLTLIPIELYFEKNFLTIILLNDFHYHEYQRRSQQQQNLMYYNDNQQQSSDGWWQPPPISSSSSRQKRPLSHFKLQRPIFF